MSSLPVSSGISLASIFSADTPPITPTTKDGEILKEQSEKGSIKDAVELGKRIGKLFEDYV